MEIERKFLVTQETLLKVKEEYVGLVKRIIQGYNPGNPGERIRTVFLNGTYSYSEYTRKTGEGLVRDEYNVPLNIADTQKYWGRMENIVTKNRYSVKNPDGLLFEYDEYLGHLKGLFVVEVEFETIEQADGFVVPEFFGDEVTGNTFFANENLSKLTVSDFLDNRR